MDQDAPRTHPPNRLMSAGDLARWGVEDVAYVKQVKINDESGWAIFGADGANIGLTHDRDLAFAAVRQHDLEPFSVH